MYKLQCNMSTIDHHFSGVWKVHSDPARNIALDLTNAPFRTVGVAHQHAGSQNGI